MAAGSAFGVTITPVYSNDYSLINLGAPPSVPTNYGGINFLAGDNNTLPIAGAANGGAAKLYTVAVTRDANGHITNFAAPAVFYASAPNNDGGLAYAPNGTLLFTEYNNNAIGEIKPGSTSPDATVSLGPSGVPSSVGTLNFVPAGYNCAGNLIIGSYSNGTFCKSSLISNGDGTYGFGACTNSVSASRSVPDRRQRPPDSCNRPGLYHRPQQRGRRRRRSGDRRFPLQYVRRR